MINTKKNLVDSGTLVLTFVLTLCAGMIYYKVEKGAPWSWWWVFSPIWIYLATVIFLMLLVKLFEHLRNKAHEKRMANLEQAKKNIEKMRDDLQESVELFNKQLMDKLKGDQK